MDFEYSAKSKEWIARVTAFMDKHVYPNVATFEVYGAYATYDLGGNTLRLRNGGLLLAQNNGNTLLTVTNGNVTAGVVGSAAELYLWNAPFGDDGRRSWLGANVVDNAVNGPVRLIVSGGDNRNLHSSLTLAGQNTNTGGTVFNNSTTVLDPAGRLGTGGVTINNATLRQVSNNALFRLPGLTTTAGSGTITTPAGGTAGLAVGMAIWGLPGQTGTNLFITGVNAANNTFTVNDAAGITASTTANPYFLTNAYSGNGAFIPEQAMTLNGGAWRRQRGPTAQELKAVQDACAGDMAMMRHCRQCRADAVGLLGEDRGEEFTMDKIDGMEVDYEAAMVRRKVVHDEIIEKLDAKRGITKLDDLIKPDSKH